MWGKQSQSKPPEAAPSPPRPPEPRAEAPAAAAPAPRATAEGGAGTRITAGIAIRGDITGRESLYLDGDLRGSVSLNDASVTVGPNGRVEADVTAREIEVHGRVHGALEARERVRIGATGSVHGEIVAQRLAIEDGAVFCGTVEMLRPGEARASRSPAPARAAAVAAASGSRGAFSASVHKPEANSEGSDSAASAGAALEVEPAAS